MTSRLRYPVAPIYDTTDYLQINIVEYKSVQKNRQNLEGNTTTAVVGTPGSRKNGKKLNSVITLPIPSNVVDNNAVSYQDNSLNAIAAALTGGSIDIMTFLTGKGTFKEKLARLKGDLGNQLETAGFCRRRRSTTFSRFSYKTACNPSSRSVWWKCKYKSIIGKTKWDNL